MSKIVEVLKRLPFFEEFHLDDLNALRHMVSYQTFEPGSQIIEQGSINLNIYNLVKGKVDIYVDDHFVISFDSNGESFGEMGVVGHSLSTATVKCNTEVSMVVIDTAKIAQLTESIHYRLQMSFYKSCASILAKKLMATNAIASSWKAKAES